MVNFDKVRIEAIIPHQDDPDLHVVTREGDYPSQEHEKGRGTLEETFRSIGRDVLGRVLSVDKRRYDLEREQPGGIVYQAKPITHTFDSKSDYSWQKRM
ncbi:MAG: hypothetical protein JWP06_336 [Candidatus Saccharibacteria bacterium]|nr:hypothetical protein [Candidatus Saccharibacteria bacterium]